MISIELLNKLSVLARVQVNPDQVDARLRDFESILGCIDELNTVTIPEGFQVQHNVVNHARLDIVTPASDDTVQRIRDAFPDRQLDYLKVPQVLKK